MSGLKFFFCNKKLIYKKTTQSAVLWFFSNFLHFLEFFDFDINTLMMTQQSMFFMFVKGAYNNSTFTPKYKIIVYRWSIDVKIEEP